MGEAASYGDECVINDGNGWKKGTGQIMTFGIESKNTFTLPKGDSIIV
jgi:hypothetical protein